MEIFLPLKHFILKGKIAILDIDSLRQRTLEESCIEFIIHKESIMIIRKLTQGAK